MRWTPEGVLDFKGVTLRFEILLGLAVSTLCWTDPTDVATESNFILDLELRSGG
jgi:hypothetical protein